MTSLNPFFYRMLEDTVAMLCLHDSSDDRLQWTMSKVVFQIGIRRCLEFRATDNLTPVSLPN